MLDVLDKLSSVSSAVFGFIGLVLTVTGVWRDRRRGPDAPPRTPQDDPRTTTSTATAPEARRELIVPERSEWVPDAGELPGYGGGPAPGHAPPDETSPAPGGRVRALGPLRASVRVGLVLLAVAIVLGAISAFL